MPECGHEVQVAELVGARKDDGVGIANLLGLE